MIKVFVLACVLGVIGATACSGTPISSYSGTFFVDNAVQLFEFHVPSTADVTVRTTSFAEGDFAPILSLFEWGHVNETMDVNLAAFLWADNGLTTNDCGKHSIDTRGTGTCYDALVSWNALAGVRYLIALTQYDNSAIGPTLGKGFQERVYNPDVPNFTAALPFNAPGVGEHFLLPNYMTPADQRGGHWTVEFATNGPGLSVTAIPEPATAALFLAGVGLTTLANRARRNRRR